MNYPKFLHAQRGVALFIVLIFLAILAMLGVTAMQSSALGEKVARNQVDHALATQAAEAALRDAERDLLSKKANGTDCIPNSAGCRTVLDRPIIGKDQAGVGLFDQNCTNGQCKMNEASYFTTPVWLDPAKTAQAVTYGTFTAAPQLPGVAQQPRYLIEGLERSTNYIFRITAQGFGANPNTQVTLQSIYVLRPS